MVCDTVCAPHVHLMCTCGPQERKAGIPNRRGTAVRAAVRPKTKKGTRLPNLAAPLLILLVRGPLLDLCGEAVQCGLLRGVLGLLRFICRFLLPPLVYS